MKLIWYPFHVADYARDTAHLSMIEHGAYRLLLDHYYMTGSPLPANAQQLHRICRAFADAEQHAIEGVLREFFVLTDDGWKHERVEEELEQSRQLSEKRRQAAVTSHSKRRNKGERPPEVDPPAEHEQLQEQSKCSASAVQVQTQSQSQVHSSLSTDVAKEELSREATTATTRIGGLCKQLRRMGIGAAPHLFAHPDWQALLARFDDDAIIGAAELAKQRNPSARMGINYLVPILSDPPKPPPAAQPQKRRTATSGRQAAIDNYAAEAAAARGEQSNGQHSSGSERDITGQCERIE